MPFVLHHHPLTSLRQQAGRCCWSAFCVQLIVNSLEHIYVKSLNSKVCCYFMATSINSLLIVAFVCPQKTCHQQEATTRHNIVKSYNITPTKNPFKYILRFENHL